MKTLRNHSHARTIMASLLLILSASGCNLPGNTGQPAVQSPPAGATTVLPTSTVAEPTLAEPTAIPEQPTETQPAMAQPAEVQPTAIENGIPSPTPAPTQAAPAFEGAACETEVCESTGSFFLKRPVGAGGRNTIVGSSRFGEYNRILKGAFHGAFFLNSTGTPVLAAADGVVVLAGDDSGTPYGPYKNLYGNLVVIRHELPGLSEPFFTLYGHLSEILVQANDSVSAGQEIAKVGMSGDVSGSTLVFEVRMGENGYPNARNPGLWIEPLTGEDGNPLGALAGRIMDSSGKLLAVRNINVEQLAGPGLPAADTFYLKTYAETGISGQQPWGENFAAWDLPAGQYQITFWLNSLHQRVVEILPGKLTLVTFRID